MSCPETAKVDLHFEQRISPSEERAMREHLPGCDACRKRYEKHLLLEKLDPAARGAGPRLASGLGLGAPSGGVLRFLSRPQAGVIGALAVAACVAFLVHRLPATTAPDPAGFSARGGGSATATAGSEITVYRGNPGAADAAAVRAGAAIRRSDELAFAYRNPGAKRFLMIYGVDEHRRVYWYYPAWTDPSENPKSVAIETTASPRPLPDAVRHPLEGSVLDIHAVFTDSPLDVRTVERLVGEGKPAGSSEQTMRFRVEP